jgi:hypothetical protein
MCRACVAHLKFPMHYTAHEDQQEKHVHCHAA